MKLTITRNLENIEIIPDNFKNEQNPPKFIFKNPDSSDVLNFLWGGKNIDEAVYNCFLGFENKIELEDENGKSIEYNTYEEFIKAGVSGEIALIHNQIRNTLALALSDAIKKGNETEKKSELPLNSGAKAKPNSRKN